jgi:hypothetical protein
VKTIMLGIWVLFLLLIPIVSQAASKAIGKKHKHQQASGIASQSSGEEGLEGEELSENTTSSTKVIPQEVFEQDNPIQGSLARSCLLVGLGSPAGGSIDELEREVKGMRGE